MHDAPCMMYDASFIRVEDYLIVTNMWDACMKCDLFCKMHDAPFIMYGKHAWCVMHLLRFLMYVAWCILHNNAWYSNLYWQGWRLHFINQYVGCVHDASCIMHDAYCIMHDASWIMHDAWSIFHYAWCIFHYVWCMRHLALCMISLAWCMFNDVWGSNILFTGDACMMLVSCYMMHHSGCSEIPLHDAWCSKILFPILKYT
jgi:hypothetical protein